HAWLRCGRPQVELDGDFFGGGHDVDGRGAVLARANSGFVGHAVVLARNVLARHVVVLAGGAVVLDSYVVVIVILLAGLPRVVVGRVVDVVSRGHLSTGELNGDGYVGHADPRGSLDHQRPLVRSSDLLIVLRGGQFHVPRAAELFRLGIEFFDPFELPIGHCAGVEVDVVGDFGGSHVTAEFAAVVVRIGSPGVQQVGHCARGVVV